jgi:hypothetical protein
VDREALLGGLVQPGDRPPAPGALRRVRAFVNTVDREHGPDLLDEPAGLPGNTTESSKQLSRGSGAKPTT